MANATLIPDATNTTGGWSPVGGSIHTVIGDDPSSSGSEATYLDGTIDAVTAEALLSLNELPVDAQTITGVTYRVRARRSALGDDTHGFVARIDNTDGSVVLATAGSVSVTSTIYGLLTFSPTSILVSDATQWTNPRVGIATNYTRNMGADSVRVQVAAFDIAIVYTPIPLAPTHVLNPKRDFYGDYEAAVYRSRRW